MAKERNQLLSSLSNVSTQLLSPTVRLDEKREQDGDWSIRFGSAFAHVIVRTVCPRSFINRARRFESWIQFVTNCQYFRQRSNGSMKLCMSNSRVLRSLDRKKQEQEVPQPLPSCCPKPNKNEEKNEWVDKLFPKYQGLSWCVTTGGYLSQNAVIT